MIINNKIINHRNIEHVSSIEKYVDTFKFTVYFISKTEIDFFFDEEEEAVSEWEVVERIIDR